ncbi:MAG: OmpA family protein [Kofleriaceae bacterium]
MYGINFDFNSDHLRAESKVVLDKIVAVLVAHPDWQLRIEGHTDNVGGAAYNQKLSEQRAAAVVAYLTGAKIAPARLSSSGAGLTSPIDSNDTDIGRARNRRVELVKP